MAKKKRLGRGLDALIPDIEETVAARTPADTTAASHSAPDAAVEAATVSGVQEIALRLIDLNPKQPRLSIDKDALESLAESIRNTGVIQPVLVRPKGERYELVAGERRVRASKLAEMEAVPAIVRDIPDEQLLEIALIENIQRADLNPIERAVAVRQLMQELELTQEEVGHRLGFQRSSIANMLRLLELPDEVQEMVSRGTLSAGHVRPLLALPLDAARIRVARKIEKLGLSVREAEALVRREAASPTKPQVREPAPHIVRMEESLSMTLGTKVVIQQKRKGGRVVIHFRTNDDFERLYEALTGRETIDDDL